MATESKPGPMALATKATTTKAKSMVKDSSPGPMAAPTMVISTITTSRASASTTGVIKEHTSASGELIKWKVKANLTGQMAADMRASTQMTRRKATEFSRGPTVASTMVPGSTVSKKVVDATQQRAASPRKETGKMARESTGLSELCQVKDSHFN